MFVTPQHQVKELRDEAGRNIVGGTMLCSELGREGVYTCRKEQRGEEKREEQEGGKEGEKGRRRGGKGGTHMHTYVPVL